MSTHAFLPLDERVALRSVSRLWRRSTDHHSLWVDVNLSHMGPAPATGVPPLLRWIVTTFGDVIRRLTARGCLLSAAALAEVATYCEWLEVLDVAVVPEDDGWLLAATNDVVFVPADARRPDLCLPRRVPLSVLFPACATITAMDLRRTVAVDDAALAELARCAVDLVVLRLDGSDVTDTGVQALVAGCPALRLLDFAQCRLTDSSLHAIRTRCPNLEVLRLVGIADVTDTGLCALVLACKHLRTLILRDCPRVGDETLVAASQSLHHLQRLCVAGAPRPTETGVEEVLQRCAALQVVDLMDCAGTSVSAVSLALTLPALRSLSVGGVCAAELEDLLHASCPTLSELTLHHATDVTDSGLSDLAHFATNLTSLSLRHCKFTGFTNLAFAVLWRKLRRLQYLDLSHTSVSAEAVCFLPYHCPPLRFVDLSYCPAVNDEAVRRLAVGTHSRLRTLALRGCSRVTDKAVWHLGQTCQGLESLDVVACRVTDTGIATAVERLPRLSQFRLGAAAGASATVSNKAVKLLAHLPVLECVELVACRRVSVHGLQWLPVSRLLSLCVDRCDGLGADLLPLVAKARRLRQFVAKGCRRMSAADAGTVAEEFAERGMHVTIEPS